MSLLVNTGSLYVWKNDRRTLDTTIKSGDKAFSPTWDMVIKYKGKKMSEEEYIKQYISLMKTSFINHGERWGELLLQDEVILACYCPPGTDFCHRYLLAQILCYLGARRGYELLGGKAALTMEIPFFLDRDVMMDW